MDALTLVTTLNREGFTLRPLPGEKIEVRPAGRLTQELREELRQKKAEVLRLLTSRPDREPTPGATLEPVIFWTDSRKIDPENPPVPYLNSRQELVIPCESEAKYKWWDKGQTIRETLVELGAPLDVIARYVDETTTMRVKQ